MSDEHTPTTDDTHTAWMFFSNDTEVAEFDRWLNEQLALAFEQGQTKGMDVRNPYRKTDS